MRRCSTRAFAAAPSYFLINAGGQRAAKSARVQVTQGVYTPYEYEGIFNGHELSLPFFLEMRASA